MDEEATVELIGREVIESPPSALRAYLHGAARDGTFNRQHQTWRISQSNRAWLVILRDLIARLGRKAWLYREGTRDVWALETKLDLRGPEVYESRIEKVAFVRGYFDAEGGVPRMVTARFYVQFVQKDRADLGRLRDLMGEEGLACGRLHNPSRRVDPDYWRFYVRAESHALFAYVVSSWHPRKRVILNSRFDGQPTVMSA